MARSCSMSRVGKGGPILLRFDAFQGQARARAKCRKTPMPGAGRSPCQGQMFARARGRKGPVPGASAEIAHSGEGMPRRRREPLQVPAQEVVQPRDCIWSLDGILSLF